WPRQMRTPHCGAFFILFGGERRFDFGGLAFLTSKPTSKWPPRQYSGPSVSRNIVEPSTRVFSPSLSPETRTPLTGRRSFWRRERDWLRPDCVLNFEAHFEVSLRRNIPGLPFPGILSNPLPECSHPPCRQKHERPSRGVVHSGGERGIGFGRTASLTSKPTSKLASAAIFRAFRFPEYCRTLYPSVLTLPVARNTNAPHGASFILAEREGLASAGLRP